MGRLANQDSGGRLGLLKRSALGACIENFERLEMHGNPQSDADPVETSSPGIEKTLIKEKEKKNRIGKDGVAKELITRALRRLGGEGTGPDVIDCVKSDED